MAGVSRTPGKAPIRINSDGFFLRFQTDDHYSLGGFNMTWAASECITISTVHEVYLFVWQRWTAAGRAGAAGPPAPPPAAPAPRPAGGSAPTPGPLTAARPATDPTSKRGLAN